jgi:hypothetical protein
MGVIFTVMTVVNVTIEVGKRGKVEIKRRDGPQF